MVERECERVTECAQLPLHGRGPIPVRIGEQREIHAARSGQPLVGAPDLRNLFVARAAVEARMIPAVVAERVARGLPRVEVGFAEPSAGGKLTALCELRGERGHDRRGVRRRAPASARW